MKNIEVIKYQTNTKELDIRIDYDRETTWLSLEEISLIFESANKEIIIIDSNRN